MNGQSKVLSAFGLWTSSSTVILAWLATSARAQGTTVSCLPGNEFLNNALGQTPCMLFAILSSGCNSSAVSISPLPQGEQGKQLVYLNPPNNGIGPSSLCTCNSVTYSIMSACSICQSQTYMTWDNWSGPCSSKALGQFSTELPPGASVPAWAFASLPSTGTFDVAIAREVQGPDSSGSPVRQTSTTTLAPSPTFPKVVTSSSQKPTSNPVSQTSSKSSPTTIHSTTTGESPNSVLSSTTSSSEISSSTTSPTSSSATDSGSLMMQHSHTKPLSSTTASPTSAVEVSRVRNVKNDMEGGIIGGLALCIVICIAGFVYWKRKRDRTTPRETSSTAISDSFDADSELPTYAEANSSYSTHTSQSFLPSVSANPTRARVDSSRASATTLLRRFLSFSSRWPMKAPRSRRSEAETCSWISAEGGLTTGDSRRSNGRTNRSTNTNRSVQGSLSAAVSSRRAHRSIPTESPVDDQKIEEGRSEDSPDDATVVEPNSEFAVVGSEVGAWTVASLEFESQF
ncbi:hypothetical protein SCHPADRAFT_942608 [Schizopora paradoxa]|uniref:Mid2 domain-containing protein n=1 Tax=Schizopora paradoxa TaxID=27342 RepID=A0A0H2S142_9AGAM|nr:hypothetical protein SCHPADRAFT_942608 [Schizopora paradoxa]